MILYSKCGLRDSACNFFLYLVPERELKETSVTAFHEIKNALNEKPSIVLTEDFKEKSMEAMPKKRISLTLVLKEIPKILVYVLIVLPNVVFLNFWLAKFFSNSIPVQSNVWLFWSGITIYCSLVNYSIAICEKKI